MTSSARSSPRATSSTPRPSVCCPTATFEVLRILDDAAAAARAPDRPRVQLAVLKLFEEAAGTHGLETVARWAKDDWRDVLAWAQYPRDIRRLEKLLDGGARRAAHAGEA